MGEVDVRSIMDGLAEVKTLLRDQGKALGDLQVLVAGNYVTKTDFQEYQKIEEARVVALHQKIDAHEKAERAERWKVVGAALAISTFVFGIIQWVVGLFRGGHAG